MVENNVKENLIDDEEELYVNLNDLVNLRESAELKEAADACRRPCLFLLASEIVWEACCRYHSWGV